MIMKFEPHKKKINGPKFVFEEWGNGLKSVEKLNQQKIQKTAADALKLRKV